MNHAFLGRLNELGFRVSGRTAREKEEERETFEKNERTGSLVLLCKPANRIDPDPVLPPLLSTV